LKSQSIGGSKVQSGVDQHAAVQALNKLHHSSAQQSRQNNQLMPQKMKTVGGMAQVANNDYLED
jgi:hypothetical protein